MGRFPVSGNTRWSSASWWCPRAPAGAAGPRRVLPQGPCHATADRARVYTCEPFACERGDGVVVVTSRLTGTFPGSPVDLRFFFVLEGDTIASLEIIP